MNAAALIRDLGGQRFRRRPFRDVERVKRRGAISQKFPRPVQSLMIDIDQHQSATASCKLTGNSLAETVSRAGDNRHGSLIELHVGRQSHPQRADGINACGAPGRQETRDHCNERHDEKG